ncbi:MAG: hypothetical protein FWC36_05635 [Spirochaetes bacterium]|nr:hypothetical protein [Spirochaetota bacterium]
MRSYLFFVLFVFFGVTIAAAEDELKFEIANFSNRIFYEGTNPLVKNEIRAFTGRRNNFIAQATFNIPLKIPQDNAIQKIEDILTDVGSFNQIPYFSRRTGRTTALFRNISILSDSIDDKTGNRIIIANVTIPPFRPVDMKFEITRADNFIMFRAFNLDRARYWIFPIVDEERMFILFAGELDNKILRCYGLGVADTGSFFLFRRAIEEEFIGRAEAIINWFHSLLRTRLGNQPHYS